MMAALKIYFLKKLKEEPWIDVEPTLCYEVQRISLFKEKNISDVNFHTSVIFFIVSEVFYKKHGLAGIPAAKCFY